MGRETQLSFTKVKKKNKKINKIFFFFFFSPGIWGGTTAVALKKIVKQKDTVKFSEEISLLASVNHPNCVKCFGYFRTGNPIYYENYIVMEFLEFGTLHALVQKRSFGVLELLKMAQGACAGLKYLADRNIVHCDVALRNLLVDSNLVVKVADFGMSDYGDGRGACKKKKKKIS